jgi:Ni/Co efflux regulator RcnB
MAQSRGEVRRDQREVQQSQREVQQERREALRDGRIDRGDRREINQAQRELRDDRRELREDRRDMRQTQRWSRGNRDWWRGRSDFRGYSGLRAGFWFAPGYGYIRSDPRYARHIWRRGEYVPSAYRRYYVPDPYLYGLRAAPPGYRWVYLDNDVVLMSLATGLIADALLDIF